MRDEARNLVADPDSDPRPEILLPGRRDAHRHPGLTRSRVRFHSLSRRGGSPGAGHRHLARALLHPRWRGRVLGGTGDGLDDPGQGLRMRPWRRGASVLDARLDGGRSCGSRGDSDRLEVSADRAGRGLDRDLVRTARRTGWSLRTRQRESSDASARHLPRAPEGRAVSPLAQTRGNRRRAQGEPAGSPRRLGVSDRASGTVPVAERLLGASVAATNGRDHARCFASWYSPCSSSPSSAFRSSTEFRASPTSGSFSSPAF